MAVSAVIGVSYSRLASAFSTNRRNFQAEEPGRASVPFDDRWFCAASAALAAETLVRPRLTTFEAFGGVPLVRTVVLTREDPVFSQVALETAS